ncbi:LOW QUALITY PROTEIN: exportin-4-like [Palaemon carinicauda]|uniref:LOW QUALITY PROTEIN: exportin-4-like n=1 Tax=Palaemon carinicauda TaxID=392227 RepID=UPI0035B5B69E
MEQLEKAAQILMAPPDLVTSEQRHEAEQVFLQLRNTKNPFNLCRQLLEGSQVDYLLFEAATLLRVGVIREWRDLSKEDILQLRQYIVHYVVSRHNLPHYVRETLVQVVGIMVKRGSVEDQGEDRGRLLTEVEQLVSAGDNTMRMIGCSILSALMQEYAVTVKSTDVGLTWETHFKAKKQFEGTDLRRIFHFMVNLLGEVVKVEGKLNEELSALLMKLLLIAETTLTWSFISLHLPKRLMSVFEQDQNPSLRPGQQWRETFLDPTIVQLFFKLYWRVREDWELGHHALNCLVQLASLNGAVLINREVRIKYLTQYLECLFSLLSSAQITEVEALGISNIFRKLLLFFPPSVLVALPKEMLHQLVENLTALTCKFAQGAALEEMFDHEDQLYMEAFEQMLQSWACILQESSSCNSAQIKQSATLIFDTYLKCHLAPPDGSRRPIDADEISETVQADRVAFKDQMVLIGLCGRQAPEHSVPLLTQLLEDRVGRMRTQLTHILSNNLTIAENSQLDQLYEDIHWLLLIAGHVTTMDNEGETALIPAEMVTYSISAVPNVDLEATLRLLAAPAQMPADIPNSSSSDPLIRMMSTVLRLCETESQALKANLGHLLSPEVSSSLMWFLRRFCLSYLLPNESFYSELSLALTSAFGRDSEGAGWTLNYLLSVVEQTLRLRSAEPGLVEDTVNLLVTMVDSKERGQHLVKTEGLMELVKLQQSGTLGTLSSVAQRGLMQGLVMCAAALGESEARTQFWTHVLDPPVTSFKQLVSAESFAKQYQQEEMKKQVLYHIDNFIGAVQGCLMPTAQCLFTRLVGVLNDSVRLLDLYHNYPTVVETVLELFVECGRRMLCYLTPSASKQLYEASVQLVGTYAKHNIGRRTVEARGEEDQWRDLQLLMELLTSLLSKDFIDLAPTGHGEDHEVVAAADVCLYGLNIIMPLMSHELLRLPTLCSQYFKMVTFIAEIYPSKVCQLPEDLMKNLLASIELGLTSFGPDVGTLSFDFLVVLGSYIHKNCNMEFPVRQGLRPFLKLVLDLILSQQINSDLLQAASAALYTLICCFQVEYQELVQALLQSQADQTIGQRLAESFTQLTTNVELSADRINRIKFRDNFEKFIANVRGFLLVK